MNPSGSPKDRFTKKFLDQLEAREEEELNPSLGAESGTPSLRSSASPSSPRTEVVEGSSGSTGISLALMCAVRGQRPCRIFMPSDQSAEKQAWMRLFGAIVDLVPPAAFANPSHFVRQAERFVQERRSGMSPYGVGGTAAGATAVFVDQFEAEANSQAHYETTGPEIWEQTLCAGHRVCGRRLDAVVLSAGTSGTLAGVSKALKDRDPSIWVLLADPPGSGLAGAVRHGTLFGGATEMEGTRRRAQVDSIVQGVGLNRWTRLFRSSLVDDAVRIEDLETILMSRFLVQHEGSEGVILKILLADLLSI
jgi:cysteine synthase A